MGRPQAEPQHLPNTSADNNIGISVLLYPQPVAPGVTDWGTTIPQMDPRRLLLLTGPSRRGQTTTVALTASRVVGPDNPSPGIPGPITGMIEIGNGGQFTRVEVDGSMFRSDHSSPMSKHPLPLRSPRTETSSSPPSPTFSGCTRGTTICWFERGWEFPCRPTPAKKDRDSANDRRASCGHLKKTKKNRISRTGTTNSRARTKGSDPCADDL
jgi:hypothetical protein